MKYPLRRNYHGIRAHQHWMKDIMRWRKDNRIIIARLAEPLEIVDFNLN